MSVEGPVACAFPATSKELASSAGSVTKASILGSKPSLVVHKPMRFLIMDAPRQGNLHLYIKECKRHHVTDIVRVCEPTYWAESDLRNAGIELHEMAYDDGQSPPKEIISQWLELVQKRFYASGRSGDSSTAVSSGGKNKGTGGGSDIAPIPTSHESHDSGEASPASGERTIAVHCVAGLGRAPVMVAIALIEFAGYDPVDAVSFIRKYRRGAINEKQLNYLEQYTRQANKGCACVIM